MRREIICSLVSSCVSFSFSKKRHRWQNDYSLSSSVFSSVFSRETCLLLLLLSVGSLLVFLFFDVRSLLFFVCIFFRLLLMHSLDFFFLFLLFLLASNVFLLSSFSRHSFDSQIVSCMWVTRLWAVSTEGKSFFPFFSAPLLTFDCLFLFSPSSSVSCSLLWKHVRSGVHVSSSRVTSLFSAWGINTQMYLSLRYILRRYTTERVKIINILSPLLSLHRQNQSSESSLTQRGRQWFKIKRVNENKKSWVIPWKEDSFIHSWLNLLFQVTQCTWPFKFKAWRERDKSWQLSLTSSSPDFFVCCSITTRATNSWMIFPSLFSSYISNAALHVKVYLRVCLLSFPSHPLVVQERTWRAPSHPLLPMFLLVFFTRCFASSLKNWNSFSSFISFFVMILPRIKIEMMLFRKHMDELLLMMKITFSLFNILLSFLSIALYMMLNTWKTFSLKSGKRERARNALTGSIKKA